MAQLHHSTLRFATAASDSNDATDKAQFFTLGNSCALITKKLLDPCDSVFADLISDNITNTETKIIVVIDAQAVNTNPDLKSRIDSYFSAHPSLNYSSCQTCSSPTSIEIANSTDQLLLVFGGYQFQRSVVMERSQTIAIVTQTVKQSITDYDALAGSLHSQDTQSQFRCVCFDSNLIISNDKKNRNTWVVRGIQHAVFHDSQMFHWIEGNLYQLLADERSAIDHLFIKVFNQILASDGLTNAESYLHRLFFELWQSKQDTLSLSLSGYAQAMTSTLLLCVRYAVEAESLEEGVDARLMHLLKQFVWIAPGNARRLKTSQSLSELPVLTSLGTFEMDTLNKTTMQAAEKWFSAEAEKLGPSV